MRDALTSFMVLHSKQVFLPQKFGIVGNLSISSPFLGHVSPISGHVQVSRPVFTCSALGPFSIAYQAVSFLRVRGEGNMTLTAG